MEFKPFSFRLSWNTELVSRSEGEAKVMKWLGVFRYQRIEQKNFAYHTKWCMI